MSKVRDCIDADLSAWIGQQRVFFVATAPLSQEGHVNCSPKGGDAFRILGPMEAAYQDYTGSGAETAAHLRENGRILVMFCAFEGKPNIVRLHGVGEVLTPGNPRFEYWRPSFPAIPAHAPSFISVSNVSPLPAGTRYRCTTSRLIVTFWTSGRSPKARKDWQSTAPLRML